MNIFIFGLYYLIYTLIFAIIGVLVFKYILKVKISKYFENKLDNFFNCYGEGDDFEEISFDD